MPPARVRSEDCAWREETQTYLLPTVTWNARSELHVDECTRQRNEQSDDPDEEGQTDASGEPEDGSRRAEGNVGSAFNSGVA